MPGKVRRVEGFGHVPVVYLCLCRMFLRSFSRIHGCTSKGALERSLSTLRKTRSPVSTSLPNDSHAFSTYSFQHKKQSPPKPPKIYTHTIVTLDPKKFAEKNQKCLDIGDLQGFIPHILLPNQSGPVYTCAMHYDRSVGSMEEEGVIRPYPLHTKAFLYYSIPQGKPRIAGELRLRVTSSYNVASFESGSDLLLPDGQLWSRPLYRISKDYPSLYEKLKEDRFIPDDLDRVLAALPPKQIFSPRIQLLYTLNDEFFVDISSRQLNFLIVSEHKVEKLKMLRLFSDTRPAFRGSRPYTGAYTCHHLSILLY